MSQWLQSFVVYTVYFVSHTDYTNIRKTYVLCGGARLLANVFWETINQRSSVSEGETAVSVRCERDRGTRILYTSASIHRTKQNKNDRFPFHFMYIICIHIYYYVIERDDPLSLCKHACTVYLRKDLYI